LGTIRFLLAISVIIAHTGSVYGYKLVDGHVAVQAFYIISGFYMTLILNEKYLGQKNSYRLFIINRLLRLYPLYWIILLFTVIVSAVIILISDGASAGKLQPYLDYLGQMDLTTFVFLIFTNITFLFQDWVMFLGIDIHSGLLFFTKNYKESNPELWQFLPVQQAWTIGIEITFYLLAPFIVRKNIKTIMTLLVISGLVKMVLYLYGMDYDPWTYRFLPAELFFFFLGIITYHVYRKVGQSQIKGSILHFFHGLLILITLTFSIISFDYKIFVYLLLFATCLPFSFVLSKNWKKDRFIGELSYPIYMSHMLVLMIIEYSEISQFIDTGLLTIIVTIFLSLILNKIVTNRIELLRQNRFISYNGN
jgi:peptidoglycan/LPS O-acetylase OafA/YrhL